MVCRQRPETAKGTCFLLIEDEAGLVNVIVQPDLYQAQRPIVRSVPLVIVSGKIQRVGNNINLVARTLTPIDCLDLGWSVSFGQGRRDPWLADEYANPETMAWPESNDITAIDVRSFRATAHSFR